MPIQKVGSKYRYGKTGKLYDTREEALRQMRAIKAREGKAKQIAAERVSK